MKRALMGIAALALVACGLTAPAMAAEVDDGVTALTLHVESVPLNAEIAATAQHDNAEIAATAQHDNADTETPHFVAGRSAVPVDSFAALEVTANSDSGLERTTRSGLDDDLTYIYLLDRMDGFSADLVAGVDGWPSTI